MTSEDSIKNDIRRKAALIAANDTGHLFCIERGCCSIQWQDSIWCRKHYMKWNGTDPKSSSKNR